MAQTDVIDSNVRTAYGYTNSIHAAVTNMTWSVTPETEITVSNIAAAAGSNSTCDTLENALAQVRTPMGNAADMPADIAEKLEQVDAANAGAAAGGIG